MKTNLALAEDNLSLAKSLKEKLLLFDEDIRFVFHAENGNELLHKLGSENNIDIILMDIEMPELDGINATKIVTDKYPDIKVIMLTVFDDEEKIFEAIKAGAKGYLLKDEPPDKIYEGIQMILEGGSPMSPIIAAKTLELLRNPSTLYMHAKHNFALTKREIEVLEQISQGLDYNEISEKLFISPFTVRKHIENIYKKLEVNNKMQAVQKAMRHRIL